jgi:hypothetical protein
MDKLFWLFTPRRSDILTRVQGYQAKEANHQHLRQQKEISVSLHLSPQESVKMMQSGGKMVVF